MAPGAACCGPVRRTKRHREARFRSRAAVSRGEPKRRPPAASRSGALYSARVVHREGITAIAPEAPTGSPAQRNGGETPRCAQVHPRARRVRAGRKVHETTPSPPPRHAPTRPAARRGPRGRRPPGPPQGAAPEGTTYDAPSAPYGGGPPTDDASPPYTGGPPPGEITSGPASPTGGGLGGYDSPQSGPPGPNGAPPG